MLNCWCAAFCGCTQLSRSTHTTLLHCWCAVFCGCTQHTLLHRKERFELLVRRILWLYTTIFPRERGCRYCWCAAFCGCTQHLHISPFTITDCWCAAFCGCTQPYEGEKLTDRRLLVHLILWLYTTKTDWWFNPYLLLVRCILWLHTTPPHKSIHHY